MDPALWKLMRLQGRGLLRRIFRGARTPRGAVFFAFGILLFAVWMLSAAVSVRFQRRADPENVRAVVPLVVLGVCLLSSVTGATDKAIAFTPGEVDLLFPGPFSRRQLLFYKLAKSRKAVRIICIVLVILRMFRTALRRLTIARALAMGGPASYALSTAAIRAAPPPVCGPETAPRRRRR